MNSGNTIESLIPKQTKAKLNDIRNKHAEFEKEVFNIQTNYGMTEKQAESLIGEMGIKGAKNLLEKEYGDGIYQEEKSFKGLPASMANKLWGVYFKPDETGKLRNVDDPDYLFNNYTYSRDSQV